VPGFLLLHALATPGILLGPGNAGFAIATPVGLLLAACFAAFSGIELTPPRAAAVLRRQGLLRGGLALLLVAWAVVSLLELPPLNVALAEEATRTELELMAAAGVVLYAVAAARYWRLHRRRPSVMLVAVITAFALLAEAMVAVSVAHNWHASWWEWHLLMAVAFAFVAYSAQVQYAREGSWSACTPVASLKEARASPRSLMRFCVLVGGVLVVVGDQGTLDRGAELPVEPDRGVEGEQPLHHPRPQPGRDAAARAVQAELMLEGPDDRLDPLPQPVGEHPGVGFVAAGGPHQPQPPARQRGLEVAASNPLVADQHGSLGGHVGGLVQQPQDPFALADQLGVGQAKASDGASQVQISNSVAPQ
jgi:hypothetical protein